MARNNRSNRLVVPECANAINQMKYEIAAELGVPIAAHTGGLDTEFAGELGSISSAGFGQQYLGDLTSREAGSLGGGITKRLVQQAQQTLL
ncbi:alpha/beta-type small acid-soluble spore protein [Cohnella cholangitidis]|uniref:Alpha/beta-type small acid-soluble spore protein n=1 Tax=Cohnella cholangitidis TaxID=2598458 RepID=A0A7G5BXM4_9BACL|nr:alpha/beta-type small acid-soluble spore protein [Cohnella cholangitidis]QMV41708.1 alpha/beta-type small acid-soluble spore protein [Cohnella cholangitidis]